MHLASECQWGMSVVVGASPWVVVVVGTVLVAVGDEPLVAVGAEPLVAWAHKVVLQQEALQ